MIVAKASILAWNFSRTIDATFCHIKYVIPIQSHSMQQVAHLHTEK